MQSLENVQHFLEGQGLLQQAMSIGDAVDDVSGLKLASSTQTTLHHYFQQQETVIFILTSSSQSTHLYNVNSCNVDYNLIIFMLCH